MSIFIPRQETREQVPAGSYASRCYSMVHIGTVSYEFKGETITQNKVRITFELPTETRVFKDGEEAKPMVISQEYTLSLHEKSKLRPMLEGWRGKKFTEEEANDFEISTLVGVPAFISIIHNDKGYATINSISKMPKGMECPPQVNASVILDYENFSELVFEKLPEFLKAKIMTSVEYKKLKGIKTGDEPVLDKDGNEIPF